MGRYVRALHLLWPLLVVGAVSDHLSVKRKLALIQSDQVRPGATVSFTSRELTAYARGEIPVVAPEGVRNPEVVLGDGMATGKALIDFVKLRASGGQSTNWLMAKLLEGEKPVSVTVRIQSSNGWATVEPERVEINGTAISGPPLNFLIENFLLPRYPQAKIGEPFELGHNVERLDVRAGGVGVVMGR